jgi:uncharacterized membrane protein HdeD (DUF308 family)
MTATGTLTDQVFNPRSALANFGRGAGWAVALRGVIAIIFGIIALRNPSAAAGALVVVFAIYAFADGVLDFVIAAEFGRMGQRWGWYVVEGLVSIAAGIVALVYPQVTLLALVLLVGIRAIIHGIFELGAAFSWKALDSRWLLGVTGVMSIIFGILLVASPGVGALALLWTIGIYAVVLGVMLFVVGVRLTREARQMSSPASDSRTTPRTLRSTISAHT